MLTPDDGWTARAGGNGSSIVEAEVRIRSSMRYWSISRRCPENVLRSLATINIQAAALPRASRLLPWLLAQDQDVWALTETTDGPGTAHIAQGLTNAGYRVHRPTSIIRDRGVLLASRLRCVNRADIMSSVTLPDRAVCADLNTDPPVLLMALYVPSSDRAPEKVTRKRAFLSSVDVALRALSGAELARLVLCGDYNVITRDHQPVYRAFLPFEYDFLDTVAGLDLVDVHAELTPGVQAHSWIGRAGNGYRFDYIHVARNLADRVASCTYDHQPRETGLTDHAAVTLGFMPDSAVRINARQPLREAANRM
jgi:exodeoxyribonuclease-3